MIVAMSAKQPKNTLSIRRSHAESAAKRGDPVSLDGLLLILDGDGSSVVAMVVSGTE
jgi:hypothetical protein